MNIIIGCATWHSHFLLSPASKTLSLGRVFRMSDAEAETMFAISAGLRRTARRFARTVAA